MPTRGSPGLSSLASGCLASQLSSACTSRPSKSLESTSTVPPDCPNPRESQVSTLKPARRSGPVPTLPVRLDDALSGLVSRVPPQPWVWRTVGAFWPAFRPAAGKKLTWISAPSNEGTTASRAAAGAALASTSAAARKRVRAPFTRNMVPHRAALPRRSGAVAGQHRGHPVLERMRRVDAHAAHHERERQAGSRAGVAVAGPVGDAVQRAGL